MPKNLIRFAVLIVCFVFSSNLYSALDPEEKRVFDELSSKAQSGDAESQFRLGKWHLSSHGPGGSIKPDVKIAEQWFLKAAEKSHRESFMELSNIFYDKFAFSKDRNPDILSEAHKWRLLAINNDEGMKDAKFFGVTPMSEKTRADGEARANKFRASHLVK